MDKIKNKNTCRIREIEDFFSLTETTLEDKFGCKDHFMEWYKNDFPNHIYFMNISKMNKRELSKFLKCDESVFNDFNYNSEKRHSYSKLKMEYPLTYIMYENIDNYIHSLSIYHNEKIIK